MTNYQSWNCSVHGHYKFKEKYQPNCEECFVAIKEDLERTKRLLAKINSERIDAIYNLEKLKKAKAGSIIEAILKS